MMPAFSDPFTVFEVAVKCWIRMDPREVSSSELEHKPLCKKEEETMKILKTVLKFCIHPGAKVLYTAIFKCIWSREKKYYLRIYLGSQNILGVGKEIHRSPFCLTFFLRQPHFKNHRVSIRIIWCVSIDLVQRTKGGNGFWTTFPSMHYF